MSSQYKIVRLRDILQSNNGENDFSERTADFSCPLNPDVEHFLKSTAVYNQKRHLSRTTLVYAIQPEHRILVGYYALAMQVLDLSSITSKTLRRRITGFSRDDKLSASVFLLGQLGKNFHDGHNGLITGTELFQLAMQDIIAARNMVGGRIVLVECKNIGSLAGFYEGLGFRLIEEADKEDMLKYIAVIDDYV